MVSFHDPMWQSHALHGENTRLRSAPPNRCNAAPGPCPDGAVSSAVFVGHPTHIYTAATPGTSLSKNLARRGEWRLHYVTQLVQALCQRRPSSTAVFTVFWWYCVHTYFETYRIRYVSNVQCSQVIQASFQKIPSYEAPLQVDAMLPSRHV